MKKILLFIFLLLIATNSALIAQECLMLGQSRNPAEAESLFKQALIDWNNGLETKALKSYESALIADSSILKYDDQGMAKKLLQKSRTISPTTQYDLCKQAFFENILVGNLEGSIALYEKAAQTGPKENQIKAADEASRLKAELEFIRSWQKTIEQKIAAERKNDLASYLKKDRLKQLEFEVSDNQFAIEELKERLAFLQQQEKEAANLVFSSMRKASRYRRRYYYPGSTQDSTPDPDTNTFPDGTWSNDGSLPDAQVPNPYNSMNNSANNKFLYRHYIYRGKTKRAQSKLEQIRTEIAGISSQITKLEKANKELSQKQKEQNAPLKSIKIEKKNSQIPAIIDK